MRRGASVVTNQVFLAHPWRTIRKKYEKCRDELKAKSPLSYIIVGTDPARQRAEDLFEIIKSRLYSSSCAIVDATGGNANVALEYGLAEARGIDCALYLCTHAREKKPAKDSPIIADLAGKRRNHYKQKEGLLRLLRASSAVHSYTRKFERAFQAWPTRAKPGQKVRKKTLGLKIIHALDGEASRRRGEITSVLLREKVRPKYSHAEIDRVMNRLVAKGLINAGKSGRSKVRIR